MNATYIVETHIDRELYMMAGGVYVVNAKSPVQAKRMVEDSKDMGAEECVHVITRVDKRKKGVMFSQRPVIE